MFGMNSRFFSVFRVLLASSSFFFFFFPYVFLLVGNKWGLPITKPMLPSPYTHTYSFAGCFILSPLLEFVYTTSVL